MLNIYYGNENIDKEKFIFNNIKNKKGRALLLVPDQFSLQAEKDAFFYLGEDALMDLQIMDFSMLGHKAVKQLPERAPSLIDKYGRHMLLSKIVRRNKDSLETYKGIAEANSFVESVGDIITDFKRYDIDPDALAEAISGVGQGSMLGRKLKDILLIYREYEANIEGKYLDSENYIDFYADKLMKVEMVTEADVWIYGYDSFTPKNMIVIERLLKAAKSLNVVVTYDEGSNFTDAGEFVSDQREDVFYVSKGVIARLRGMAHDLGIECQTAQIGDEFEKENIWTKEDTEERIVLKKCDSVQEEVDAVVAQVMKLVMNKGYKYSEIAVACNDTEHRMGMIKRAFDRMGIPTFVDRKRNVLHHPCVAFILALLQIVAQGYKDEQIMQILKSGMLDVDRDQVQRLENYLRRYSIRGKKWKEDFTRGEGYVTSEELNGLNDTRKMVVDTIEACKEAIPSRAPMGDKVNGFYAYLKDDFGIVERLENIIKFQEDRGLLLAAEETAQSWNTVCKILNQMVAIIGDERGNNDDLFRMVRAGLKNISIGLVPASPDSVIIGTLQRSRLGSVKALVIVGANEGLIPKDPGEHGLLNRWEKKTLSEEEIEFGRDDYQMRSEETMALYRALSLPKEQLYLSYSVIDTDGELTSSCKIYNRLDAWLGEDRDDSLDDGSLDENFWDEIVTKEAMIPRVTQQLRKYKENIRRGDMGGVIDTSDDYEHEDEWKAVLGWYKKHEPDVLKRIISGVEYNGNMQKLTAECVDALYKGDKKRFVVSVSKLDKFRDCPFAYFVKYGLRPVENDVYKMGSREIGNIFHECAMRVARELQGAENADEQGAVIGEVSPRWQSLQEEECYRLVDKVLDEDLAGYNEDLFTASKVEEYRTARLREICKKNIWAMVEQIKNGDIKYMAFEKEFGYRSDIPAIEVEAGQDDERNVYIEGKIDRFDVLQVEFTDEAGNKGTRECVRVVDYKTGTKELERSYLKNGVGTQLFVYLDALNQVYYGTAGVYYMFVDEKNVKARKSGVIMTAMDMTSDEGAERMNKLKAQVDSDLKKEYRLQGITIYDIDIIKAMDRTLRGNDGENNDEKKDTIDSYIIPIMINNDGGYKRRSGSWNPMYEEEFEELNSQVQEKIYSMCRNIREGDIAVKPVYQVGSSSASGGETTGCSYCNYKGICLFDTSLPNCKYDYVEKEQKKKGDNTQ